jgi:hypothetical protein
MELAERTQVTLNGSHSLDDFQVDLRNIVENVNSVVVTSVGGQVFLINPELNHPNHVGDNF